MLLNILCSIDVDAVQLHYKSAFCPNDTKQQKNPYFIQMTLNVFFFALPFCQPQNSIMEISNDFVCLFVCLC